MGRHAIKTGCELWADCGTCPYPDCIAGAGAKLEVIKRRAEAIRLAQGGSNEEEIAKKLGRSVRQVQRYLAVAGIKT